MFPIVMDKIGMLAVALIEQGLHKDDGKPLKPRKDLFNSLNNAKAYISRDIKRVPKLSQYFPVGSVVYVDSINKGTKLYNIHEVNKENTKKGFYDSFEYANNKDNKKGWWCLMESSIGNAITNITGSSSIAEASEASVNITKSKTSSKDSIGTTVLSIISVKQDDTGFNWTMLPRLFT